MAVISSRSSPPPPPSRGGSSSAPASRASSSGAQPRSQWRRRPSTSSGGRFILGLGSSHRVQVEPEHGVPFVQPTQRLRETVDVVRGLVRDGTVTYAGKVVAIERFELWFTPLREIPIYISALFPTMLQIGGEIADGVLLTWPTTASG